MRSQDCADAFNEAVQRLRITRVRMLPEVLRGEEIRLQLLSEDEKSIVHEVGLVVPEGWTW